MEELIKICTKCLIGQELDNFPKDKRTKLGLKSICKKCTSEYLKEYYRSNVDSIKNKQKQYRDENSDIVNLSRKKWVINNPDKLKESRKKYYINNPEKIKISQKKYRDKIPHVIAWRSVIWNSLKRLNKSKEGKTIDLLGYSAIELKEHIESLFTDGMSWDNYGEWHIDHIKPVFKFDKDTPPSVVNTLNNLRPLWATTREINGVVYEGNMNRKKI